MAYKLQRTNEEVIEAYKATGSVWGAAKRLGLCGQSVWERLVRLGIVRNGNADKWDDQEDAELTLLVRNGLPFSDIARRLGRSFGAVANRASYLGLKSGRIRPRKLPRGVINKRQAQKFAKLLMEANGTFTKFCYQHRRKPDEIALAIQKYSPQVWDAYSKSKNPNSGICEYCGAVFYPMSTKQKTCTRKCQRDLRTDRQYFNGNRRNAVGLLEGICQCCGRSEKVGMTPHHVFGIKNDPEADSLVALCRGCHKLVELAAARSKVAHPEFWESLIGLAVLRATGDKSIVGNRVYVDIESFDDPEEFEAA